MMTPMERFAVRSKPKSYVRSAASPLDDARREVCRAYSAFYRGRRQST